MFYLKLILSSFILLAWSDTSMPDDERKEEILSKVNRIRASGCQCGSTYYAPAKPLVWHNTLYQSALSHAKEMSKYRYFGHYGVRGEDIGTRLDQFDYKWAVVGENLGEGQRSFDEVLRDWKDSPSHCKMLMDPRVKEMAVARHRQFWVQHFGKRLPKNASPKPRRNSR